MWQKLEGDSDGGIMSDEEETFMNGKSILMNSEGLRMKTFNELEYKSKHTEKKDVNEGSQQFSITLS